MSRTITREIRTVAAGLQFYDLPALAEALQQGVRLRPQRDPHNRADSNAISLWLERSEAEAWDLLGLIADPDQSRGRWMLGHIERGLADLAPLLDEGLQLDIFVAGGDRRGAWSVELRLEGPAAERVAASRAAQEARNEAMGRQVTEARDFHGTAEYLSSAFPLEGWDRITVRRQILERGTLSLATQEKELPVIRRDPDRRPCPGDLWEQALRDRRIETAREVFVAPVLEHREEQRRRRTLRREEALKAETAELVAQAESTGRGVALPRGAEPYLPTTWLTRADVEARGLRPERCRILGWTPTARGIRQFYAPEIDKARLEEQREARRRRRQRTHPVQDTGHLSV
ncbi:hypothetical protein [Roseomonas chloroacetimidivorans]|uniref:hypothetical protein n=1 Tax=Roseomonas chloroacetimidivorans TaxID=1766656 RepID=UPI003C70A4DA